MPARQPSAALSERRELPWHRQHRNANDFSIVGLEMSCIGSDARCEGLHIHGQYTYIKVVLPSSCVHPL